MQLQAVALHFASLGPPGGGHGRRRTLSVFGRGASGVVIDPTACSRETACRVRLRAKERQQSALPVHMDARASSLGPRTRDSARRRYVAGDFRNTSESGRRSLSLTWTQYTTSTETRSRSFHVIYLSVSSVVRRHPRSVCTIRSHPHHRSPSKHPIDLLPRAISKNRFTGRRRRRAAAGPGGGPPRSGTPTPPTRGATASGRRCRAGRTRTSTTAPRRRGRPSRPRRSARP
jgi:hypothetical protein